MGPHFHLMEPRKGIPSCQHLRKDCTPCITGKRTERSVANLASNKLASSAKRKELPA